MPYRGCLTVQKRPRSAGTSENQYPGQATARVLWELCVAGRLADLALLRSSCVAKIVRQAFVSIVSLHSILYGSQLCLTSFSKAEGAS
jgi:hypothetical protein